MFGLLCTRRRNSSLKIDQSENCGHEMSCSFYTKSVILHNNRKLYYYCTTTVQAVRYVQHHSTYIYVACSLMSIGVIHHTRSRENPN